MRRRYIIIDEAFPRHGSTARDLRWLCRVLGFSSTRDREGIPWKMLKILLEKGEAKEEDIARMLGVSRTAVSHHAEKMILAGFIRKEKGKYALSGNSLEEILAEMERDISRILDRIRVITREIDKRFKLHGRV